MCSGELKNLFRQAFNGPLSGKGSEQNVHYCGCVAHTGLITLFLKQATYSGSPCPFVSGANQITTSPTRNTHAIAEQALARLFWKT